MDNNGLSAARARARQGEVPGLPMRALVFSGVALAISVMVYVGLEFGYKSFIKASIASIDKQTEALNAKAPAAEQEKNFLELYSKAVNIQKALDSHISVSSVLDFIERTTVPEAALSLIKVVPSDRVMSFEGVAKTYDKLALQLAIYDDASETARVGLTGSTFNEGVIDFNGQMTLAASIFSFAESLKVASQPTTAPAVVPIVNQP